MKKNLRIVINILFREVNYIEDLHAFTKLIITMKKETDSV